jgi:hypothetical protein
MIHKVTFLGEGFFQLDDQSTPIDEESLKSFVKEAAAFDDAKAQEFVQDVKDSAHADLQITATKGIIVDLYEVDYPAPADPMKETEALASHLDEKHDFVTQYIFPQTETEDIVVDLRKNILQPHQKSQSAPGKSASQVPWVRVLAHHPTGVTLDIRGNKYTYSAAENDVKKFFQMYRRNRGQALAFLRKKAFRNPSKEGWRTVLTQYGFESFDAPLAGIKRVVPGTSAWQRAAIQLAAELEGADPDVISERVAEYEVEEKVNFGEDIEAMVTTVQDLLAMNQNRLGAR